MDIALWVVVLLEFAGLVTLGVLLLVARRRLASARKQVVRSGDGDGAAPAPPTDGGCAAGHQDRR